MSKGDYSRYGRAYYERNKERLKERRHLLHPPKRKKQPGTSPISYEERLRRRREYGKTPAFLAKRRAYEKANNDKRRARDRERRDAINETRRALYASKKPLFGRVKKSAPNRDPYPNLDRMTPVDLRVEDFEVLAEIDPALEIRDALRMLDD